MAIIDMLRMNTRRSLANEYFLAIVSRVGFGVDGRSGRYVRNVVVVWLMADADDDNCALAVV